MAQVVEIMPVKTARLDAALPVLARAFASRATVLMPTLTCCLAFAVFAGAGDGAQSTRILVPALGLVAWLGGRRSVPINAVVIAFILLGAGLTVSAVGSGSRQLQAPLSALLIAVLVTAAVTAAVRLGERRRVLEVLAFLGSVTGLIAVAGVAFHLESFTVYAAGLHRATATFGSSGAAAMFLSLTLPAALILCDQIPNARLPRLATFAILAGLFATLSLGVVAGVAVMLLMLRSLGANTLLRLLARPAIGALIVAAGLFPSIAGPVPRPDLVAVASGVAVLFVRTTPNLWRAGRTMRTLLAGLLIATALAGGIALTPQPASSVASRVAQPVEAIAEWRALLDVGAAHRWMGAGPGTLSAGVEQSTQLLPLRNTYLTWLAESGVAGVAAITLSAVLLLIAVISLKPHRPRSVAIRTLGVSRVTLQVFDAKHTPKQRRLWVAAVGACAAFLVHGVFDYAWQQPAVLATAFCWLALALSARRAGDPI